MTFAKKLVDVKEFRRKNKELIACGCLFLAFRNVGNDRSIRGELIDN